MTKADSKENVLNLCNNNILTIAIATVVVVIILMFFWDRQQQRAVELLRIQARLDFMQEWEPTPQQPGDKQMNNAKTPAKVGRVL